MKKETIKGMEFDNGPAHGWADVQLAAAPIVAVELEKAKKGIVVIADPDNTKTIFVGRKHVTSDKDIATGGAPLAPGASFEFPLSDVSQLYSVAAELGQKVAWVAL